MSQTTSAAGFRHQGCVYGSAAEFLATAVPFARDGLRLDEPVLVATTKANLRLLRAELGADADRIAVAEPAYFGRRPGRVAEALHRYWTRHRSTAPTGAVRVVAEPVRSEGSGAEWPHVEAGFNVALAGTRIWMICPYDTRTVDAGVVADACRTHPECVVHGEIRPSPRFSAPGDPDAAGVAAPPGTAADLFRFEGDLVAVRRHVLDRASALLRSAEAATMFGIEIGRAHV